MKKPFVIGVGGKSGAGKDAVARHLTAHHGFRVVRFADALKEEVLTKLRLTSTEIWKEYYGCPYDEPTEVELRKLIWDDKPPIMRRLLQEMGTEVRRADDPAYWTKKWKHEVYRAVDQGISVVAPDTRFPNEVSSVRDMGGEFVRVLRPGAGAEAEGHASETAVDGEEADWTFHNVADLGALFAQVDDYIDYQTRR